MTIEIKKNQIDAMAALVYSNGVSLVHVALIIGWCWVQKPKPDVALRLEELDLARTPNIRA